MAESSDSKSQSERRPATRKRVLLAGLIVHGNGTYTCDCTYRNLSASGARLEVNEHLQIPDRFYLINIRDGVAYDARMVWSKGREIGVKFESAIPLAASTEPAYGQLRRLWLAKTPH